MSGLDWLFVFPYKMIIWYFKAQREGKFDVGTMELGKVAAPAKLMKRVYFKLHDKDESTSYITTVQTERGMTFDDALALLEKNHRTDGREVDQGFYRIRSVRTAFHSIAWFYPKILNWFKVNK